MPRLTLNLGLRYDNDLGAYNTSYVPSPGLLTPNTNPNANFAPRLGFAYDPSGVGKTSIRGGGGPLFCRPGLRTPSSTSSFTAARPAPCRPPRRVRQPHRLTLPSPFAGQNPSANPSGYVSSPQPVMRGSKTPYALQLSIGAAHELGYKTNVSVDFVHTRVYDDFIALSGNLLQNPANASAKPEPHHRDHCSKLCDAFLRQRRHSA